MNKVFYRVAVFAVIIILALVLWEFFKELKSPASFEYRAPAGQKIEIIGTRIVTAYTLRPQETDDTPCIGAYNDDLCEISKTRQVCASNEFKKGTRLMVGNIECIVLDKTNPRYKNRVDIVKNNLEEALRFGRQTVEIAVINL